MSPTSLIDANDKIAVCDTPEFRTLLNANFAHRDIIFAQSQELKNLKSMIESLMDERRHLKVLLEKENYAQVELQKQVEDRDNRLRADHPFAPFVKELRKAFEIHDLNRLLAAITKKKGTVKK